MPGDWGRVTVPQENRVKAPVNLALIRYLKTLYARGFDCPEAFWVAVAVEEAKVPDGLRGWTIAIKIKGWKYWRG